MTIPPKPPYIVPQATIDYYAKDRKTYESPEHETVKDKPPKVDEKK